MTSWARFFLLLLAALLALVLALVLGMVFGAADAGWSDLSALLVDPQEVMAERIIAAYRLPRLVVAMQVGVHFALAGLIFQTALRNPLADPTVLGISGGASLAVVLAMLLAASFFVPEGTPNFARYYLPMSVVPFVALGGGVLAGALVFWLAWDGELDPTRTVLAGVAFGAIASAAVMATVLAMGGAQAEVAMIWLAGSLFGRGYEEALTIVPWTVAGVMATALVLRPVGLLRFDGDMARSMGLETRLWRPLGLAVGVALAASGVAVVGPVGFVGLVVPHAVRLVVGPNLGQQMLLCAVGGALLLVLSDVVSRSIAVPLEVPVGAVTSLIGVPVFLLLLLLRGWSLK